MGDVTENGPRRAHSGFLPFNCVLIPLRAWKRVLGPSRGLVCVLWLLFEERNMYLIILHFVWPSISAVISALIYPNRLDIFFLPEYKTSRLYLYRR